MTGESRSAAAQDPLSKYREALKKMKGPGESEAAPKDPLGLDDDPGAASSQNESESGTELPREIEELLGPTDSQPERAPQPEPEPAPQESAPSSSGGADPLSMYRQAMNKMKSGKGAAAATGRPAPAARTVSRETLNQFRKPRRAAAPEPEPEPEPEPVEEPAPRERPKLRRQKQPDARTRERPAKSPRRGRQSARPAPQGASVWRIKAVALSLLLVGSLPVQMLVYDRLGAAFTFADLGAGLSAVLPAALILAFARPESVAGWIVTALGSAAVTLIGSAGFAYGISLLQQQLPAGASPILGLLLSLGLFTAVWGPLFLILVTVLGRMSILARSGAR